MLLTPEEAKEKWCPYVRAAGEGGAGNATAERNPKHARCIADECMAWRGEFPTRMATDLGRAEKGYCGLAGEPFA